MAAYETRVGGQAPGREQWAEHDGAALLDSGRQTLVNTVNCVGVMGKGVALTFKDNCPGLFDDYQRRCDKRELALGEPYLWTSAQTGAEQMEMLSGADGQGAYGPKQVVNFPTKHHWRESTRLGDVKKGIDRLAANREAWGIESLALPALGCGNGKLNWDAVAPTLRRWLCAEPLLGIDIDLYHPQETPDKSPARLEPEWVALAETVKRTAEASGGVTARGVERLAEHMAAEGVKIGASGVNKALSEKVAGKLLCNGLLLADGELYSAAHKPYPSLRFSGGPALAAAADAPWCKKHMEEMEPVIARAVEMSIAGSVR